MTESSVQNGILDFTSTLKKRMSVNKPYLGSLYRVNANSKKATCNTVGMEELFHSRLRCHFMENIQKMHFHHLGKQSKSSIAALLCPRNTEEVVIFPNNFRMHFFKFKGSD